MISNSCDSILYADDCSLFFKFSKNDRNIVAHVNNILQNFSDWFSCNHLALNVNKTNYMVFSGKRSTLIPGIALNGTDLKQVTQCLFLGIIIDQKLSWKAHIQATCRKLAKSIGVLYKVSKMFSQNLMMQLYNSFILPYIQYGITLWGASSVSSLNPIFVLQKKALKIAQNLPLRTSSSSLFRDPKVRSIYDQYKLNTAIFMFKFNKSLLPRCFDNYFQANSVTRSHHTRSAALY